jgi:hypothetical protein
MRERFLDTFSSLEGLFLDIPSGESLRISIERLVRDLSFNKNPQD